RTAATWPPPAPCFSRDRPRTESSALSLTTLFRSTAVGTVIRLNDGRRAVVVRTGAEFVSAEYASSVCWHNDPDYVHGDAHWHLRSEEHTSELQSRENLVCRLLLEKKKKSAHRRTD